MLKATKLAAISALLISGAYCLYVYARLFITGFNAIPAPGVHGFLPGGPLTYVLYYPFVGWQEMWTCAIEQPFGTAVVEVINYYAQASPTIVAIAVWLQLTVSLALLAQLLRSQSNRKLKWSVAIVGSLLALIPAGAIIYCFRRT